MSEKLPVESWGIAEGERERERGRTLMDNAVCTAYCCILWHAETGQHDILDASTIVVRGRALSEFQWLTI